MTFYLNNCYKALFEIMKMDTHKFSVWDKYEVYYLYQEIENVLIKDYYKNKEKEFSIHNVIEYNENTFYAMKVMEKTAQQLIHFWTEIRHNKNGLKIYESALIISKNVITLKTTFHLLIQKLNCKNLEFLCLYYNFLDRVLPNDEEREIVENIIQDIETRNILTKNLTPTSNLNLFSSVDEVGTAIISR